MIAKYRPAEPFSPGAGAPESEAKRNSVNIPYFKIGIAIAVVILLWMVLKPKHAPEMTVVSFESKETITLSCDLAEKCVIVYLAPW
ncbi:MAG TPA: hypothetical protein ENH04_01905 [Nitrospirae bacterium]|nr:hypothetical protein [Nitrospirota bacterium]